MQKTKEKPSNTKEKEQKRTLSLEEKRLVQIRKEIGE